MKIERTIAPQTKRVDRTGAEGIGSASSYGDAIDWRVGKSRSVPATVPNLPSLTRFALLGRRLAAGYRFQRVHAKRNEVGGSTVEIRGCVGQRDDGSQVAADVDHGRANQSFGGVRFLEGKQALAAVAAPQTD